MDHIDHSYERFVATVGEHEDTIRMVAAGFFVPGSYLFNEMVCDLTTFLWLVYRDMPADAVVFRERRWVYSVLHRHALNRIRDDARYQQRLVYGADLIGLAGDEEVDPLVRRMYCLVAHLDDDGDRNLINMYLANVSVEEIADKTGRSKAYVYRRIKKIVGKLQRLDKELGDEADDDGDGDGDEGNSNDSNGKGVNNED